LDDDDLDAELDREVRLDDGLRRAERDRAGRLDGRALAVLAGVLVPAGILLVLLGWRGASRTPHDYDQIPYLISGGQLGSTLAIVGALCFFGYWLTVLVREQRAQGRAVVAALERIEAALRAPGGSVDPGALVATARGSLVHRPDCAAVRGKTGLRRVTGADGLERCRLCADDSPAAAPS
jgi:hypothetical protein